MGRLVLWLALAVLLPAPALLQPLDQAVLEEQEQMKELLTSMFIDNHREGRDMDDEEKRTKTRWTGWERLRSLRKTRRPRRWQGRRRRRRGRTRKTRRTRRRRNRRRRGRSLSQMRS